MSELYYKDLSYEIVGICYDAFNELGYGLREKEYQKALRQLFEDKNFSFKEQVYAPLQINNKKFGSQYLDFLIDDKLILELKVRRYPRSADFKQIRAYLARNGIKLGILVLFTPNGVETFRCVV